MDDITWVQMMVAHVDIMFTHNAYTWRIDQWLIIIRQAF